MTDLEILTVLEDAVGEVESVQIVGKTTVRKSDITGKFRVDTFHPVIYMKSGGWNEHEKTVEVMELEM